MNKPKLIFLNGFAASGKSTLTQIYLDEHKFSLGLEGDVLITMLGGWKDDWYGAAELKLLMTESLVKTHLSAGYDVVLPFLLTKVEQVEKYEKIALETKADFYEFYLELNREEAIKRLYKRGVWGEAGSPPLTEADLPEIVSLYDKMVDATKYRPDTIVIKPNFGAEEQTYREMLSHLTK